MIYIYIYDLIEPNLYLQDIGYFIYNNNIIIIL